MVQLDREEVECIVYSGTSAKELQLVENINRVDLNPMEVAKAYQSYLDAGHTVDDLSEVTGKAKGQITWSLNLLRCREDIQHLVSRGQMTVSVAGYLSKLSLNGQAQAVRAMNSEILSVSECHKLTEIIYVQENQEAMFTPEEIPVLDQKTIETRHKVDDAFERACSAFEEIARLEADNPGITGQAVADKLDITKEKADGLYKLIGEFRQSLEYKRVAAILGSDTLTNDNVCETMKIGGHS